MQTFSMKRWFRKYHKWVGLVLTPFIILFCVSGIILNHRQAFSSYDISRAWMPENYAFHNYNNGIIRGVITTHQGNIFAYGIAGVWKTDSCFSHFTEYNHGFPKGVDNRRILNMTETADHHLWCVTPYAVYQMDNSGKWLLAYESHTELEDMTTRGDSLLILSRSEVLISRPPYQHFMPHALLPPNKHSVRKVNILSMVRKLHSGELFGLGGRLFMDLMAVVMIILCITGIIFTVLKSSIRHSSPRHIARKARQMKVDLAWHNRLGRYLILFLLWITVTGICLRAPMSTMLKKVNLSNLSSGVIRNPYQDQLRGIRWHPLTSQWLLMTTKKIYHMKDLDSPPQAFPHQPKMSSMGITVFQCMDHTWLIGSLSGLYQFNTMTGEVKGYPLPSIHHAQVSKGPSIVGFCRLRHHSFIFEKRSGVHPRLPKMPETLKRQPISLWNVAVEIHTGRIFAAFLKKAVSGYVPVCGLLLVILLITGWKVGKRKR